MNLYDKILTFIFIGKDSFNPYANKGNWTAYDYMMGYGAPILMLLGVILLGYLIYALYKTY